VQPFNRSCLPVCALKVGAHEAAVPERGTQALMAEKPSHLIEPSPAAQPTRRREVTQDVRVEAPVMGQIDLGAQPVDNLRQVSILGRPTKAPG
jgi:hypothetical protein